MGDTELKPILPRRVCIQEPFQPILQEGGRIGEDERRRQSIFLVSALSSPALLLLHLGDRVVVDPGAERANRKVRGTRGRADPGATPPPPRLPLLPIPGFPLRAAPRVPGCREFLVRGFSPLCPLPGLCLRFRPLPLPRSPSSPILPTPGPLALGDSFPPGHVIVAARLSLSPPQSRSFLTCKVGTGLSTTFTQSMNKANRKEKIPL